MAWAQPRTVSATGAAAASWGSSTSQECGCGLLSALELGGLVPASFCFEQSRTSQHSPAYPGCAGLALTILLVVLIAIASERIHRM